MRVPAAAAADDDDDELLLHVGSPGHREQAQTVIQAIWVPPASEAAVELPAEDEGDAETPAAGEEEHQEHQEQDAGSHYWDASTMAPLNAVSAAAIARLRAYKPPPFPLWDRLPLSRRAAVLLLLYADRRGDLRVVITMRAASLRSFSGHAALPGGKADTLDETPYQIARREAWEEIGLPVDDTKLPPPFRIEHLCYLPMNLVRGDLVVRPCVAFLHTADPSSTAPPSSRDSSPSSSSPTAEESLIPRLDAKEVAAVFSAPFHNFLKATDEQVAPAPPPLPSSSSSPSNGAAGSNGGSSSSKLPPGKWYEGSWTTWHDTPWRVHFFYVPVTGQRVVKPRAREGPAGGRAVLAGKPSALSEHDGNTNNNRSGSASASNIARQETTNNNNNNNSHSNPTNPSHESNASGGRYKVWGMTARILVDAATVAYGEPPEFEHSAHLGDEALIEALAAAGQLGEKKERRAVTDEGQRGGKVGLPPVGRVVVVEERESERDGIGGGEEDLGNTRSRAVAVQGAGEIGAEAEAEAEAQDAQAGSGSGRSNGRGKGEVSKI